MPLNFSDRVTFLHGMGFTLVNVTHVIVSGVA